MILTSDESPEISTPAVLNLALLVLTTAVAAALLLIASHAATWWSLVLAAIAFSYVNNTVFSLLHEATHGIFHPNQRVNVWAGRIAAAYFPTSYTLQRSFHLTHHRNNRTELEQFDYFRSGDNKFLKLAQWYSILTGFYWVFAPVGCIAYFFCPRVFRRGLLRNPRATVAHQTGANAYLASVDDVPSRTIRLEIMLTVTILEASASPGSTVGADKGYDVARFVADVRVQDVTPHVAQKVRGSAIDGRTTRHAGYHVSQRKRKLVEQVFGWMKTVGGLRKLRHRGIALVDWQLTFAATAYNLVRLRNLEARCP